ncbi:MAG: hypothetical protein EPO32_00830 [Anaerolineae bacterium]|nr:MAG: hypothetical protein EPO32_00830 [Anaerolineae bacterium]
MKVITLLENLKFGVSDSVATPLHVDADGRAILFTLGPNQSIREHNAPSSPFFVVVLMGEGVFSGADGNEHTCSVNSLLVFDAGEQHAIRALSEGLVFVGFLHGVPTSKT